MSSQADVLLVEDNKQDAELIIRVFRRHNLADKLRHVRDGAQALDALFARDLSDNGGQAPKVIILDLKLPKVDGLEVLRRLKADERTRLLPVVVLTSSTQEQDVLESYKRGANSYIAKPVQYEDFVSTVSEIAQYWVVKNTIPGS